MTSEVNDLLLTITVTCAHMLVKACTHSTKHVDSVHRCMHALPNTSCKDVLTLKLGTQTDTSSKLLTPELLSKVSSKSEKLCCSAVYLQITLHYTSFICCRLYLPQQALMSTQFHITVSPMLFGEHGASGGAESRAAANFHSAFL